MKIEIIKKEDNPVAEFFSSNSSTPETDSVWDKYINYPYNCGAGDLRILAQRLERERNKAIEQRNCLHELHNKNAIHFQELLELCETLRKERDEADRSLEKEKIALNYLIKRAMETERERNEARAKVERQAERIRQLEGATNHAGGLRG